MNVYFELFEKHVYSHTVKSIGGTVEYMCDRGSCGKTFRNSTELRHHVMVHDNSLPRCPFCPWKGVGTATRNIHFDHHFEIRRFECALCPKKFFSRALANIHFENFHEKVEGKFKCKLCDFAGHSRIHLNNHMQRTHKWILSLKLLSFLVFK